MARARRLSFLRFFLQRIAGIEIVPGSAFFKLFWREPAAPLTTLYLSCSLFSESFPVPSEGSITPPPPLVTHPSRLLPPFSVSKVRSSSLFWHRAQFQVPPPYTLALFVLKILGPGLFPPPNEFSSRCLDGPPLSQDLSSAYFPPPFRNPLSLEPQVPKSKLGRRRRRVGSARRIPFFLVSTPRSSFFPMHPPLPKIGACFFTLQFRFLRSPSVTL